MPVTETIKKIATLLANETEESQEEDSHNVVAKLLK